MVILLPEALEKSPMLIAIALLTIGVSSLASSENY
jgi:hypothetical protein